jgi:hypothetical protein
VNVRHIIRSAAVIGALLIGSIAAPAQADGEYYPAWDTMKFDTRTVCIQADFPVLRSGWQIKKSITLYNASQAVIHFQLSYTPGCSIVYLHRYNAEDGHGGYTDYTGPDITGNVEDADGWTYHSVSVYLNDFYPLNDKCWKRYTVNHELTHALGFWQHTTPSETSILSYSYNVPVLCGVPDATDIARIGEKYR